MKTNMLCFTSYRRRVVAGRKAILWRSKVGQDIDELHNLRLQDDRNNAARGILCRGYYARPPKCAGGIAPRRLVHNIINRRVDELREKATPADVVDLLAQPACHSKVFV
jgi:hypothetical protein